MNREFIGMLIIMGAQFLAAYIGSSSEKKPRKEKKDDPKGENTSSSIEHQ